MNTMMNVDQVLQQMRVVAKNQRLLEGVAAQAPKADFADLLADSLRQVNSMQQEASSLRTAYEVGVSGVDLPEVMIAAQKSSVAFEAATQVRNKLLSAYQEVMNMQV